ncbi:TPA: Flp family type IVb pilin [Candidatus Bipolaricaulota bacterium]|nr:Flp family type IVb pilin [Candidatus Bipolaricaulota bacterium]
MLFYLLHWLRREEGQDLAEYALIIALVSIMLVAALTALRGNISTIFSTIGSVLAEASP